MYVQAGLQESDKPYKRAVFAYVGLAWTDSDLSALVYKWCTVGVGSAVLSGVIVVLTPAASGAAHLYARFPHVVIGPRLSRQS
jgi:hypothetical protein